MEQWVSTMPRIWRIITPENVPLELAAPLEQRAALFPDALTPALTRLPAAVLLTSLSSAAPNFV